ncbi:hypothetical protein CFC21_018595 [Triticum aestivum]|uniref:F-box domain-containing protein n=3 Tax=Triticum TaxID=4564 RepID=A0A9R1P2L2_TRITD|nr:uncharacterized protein LOC119356207 [Triticum dicoccoides]XP_044453661.1 uncharacterized protein LOC123185918 [Triticum aestivum]KAF7003244.1 hypothetical protein CFC21_018595 [Triticum aestivum]VAH35698.1 unnamed protein product [Triticum turgidum subsp. durum]
MAKAACVGAAGELLDDLLLVVFEHLPGVQDLLRCAATCKQWLCLIKDPVFLRRIGLWPETAPHPSVLVGIFYQNVAASAIQPVRRIPDSPPQFLSLQAGGGHLTFDSFVANDDGLFNFARPLASRRGLLLVRILLPTPADHQRREKLHLAVCRPLIDKRGRHLLPPPPFLVNHGFINGLRLTGYALLTDEDHRAIDDLDQQRRSSFQVVLTYTGANRVMYACGYSSATDSWSTPIKCHQVSHLSRCGPYAGVVTCGTVHWLFTDQRSFYTLNVSVATAHVSLTKIPINVHAGEQRRRVPFPCVTGERKLSFVSIRDDGVLELWAKQGQDDNDHGGEAAAGGWLRSDLINLGSGDKINLVFFAERRGAMLVEQGGAFFTIDLKSKEKALVDLKGEEMEHVRGICRFPMHRCSSSWCSGFHCSWGRISPCAYNKPVLYEVDWIIEAR